MINFVQTFNTQPLRSFDPPKRNWIPWKMLFLIWLTFGQCGKLFNWWTILLTFHWHNMVSEMWRGLVEFILSLLFFLHSSEANASYKARLWRFFFFCLRWGIYRLSWASNIMLLSTQINKRENDRGSKSFELAIRKILFGRTLEDKNQKVSVSMLH